MKKIKNIIIGSSLIITLAFTITGCATKKATSKNTTTNKTVASVKTQDNLKAQLTPLLLNFAKAESEFNYKNCTLDTLKKVKEFETTGLQETETDNKLTSMLNKITKAKGETEVNNITINALTKDEDNNSYNVEYTVDQNVISYKENNKNYSSTTDKQKFTVRVKAENGTYKISAYSIQD